MKKIVKEEDDPGDILSHDDFEKWADNSTRKNGLKVGPEGKVKFMGTDISSKEFAALTAHPEDYGLSKEELIVLKLFTGQQLTQFELAKLFGCTNAYVGQIEKKAGAKVKKALKAKSADDALEESENAETEEADPELDGIKEE